ncbi:MAG: GTPase ObgE [Candidatus Gastranaerophilales bacterium]
MKFIDKSKIKIVSGRGGNGMVAWRREKYVDKGGPAGGDGGRGGDVYLVADENMSTLMDFKHKSVFKADAGENGGIKNMHGHCAKDTYIKVPVGTVVRDVKTGTIIADLTEHDQQALVAKGGRGGRGNARFATSQKRAPQFCEPGEPEIERELYLELKLLADVGLLGMPNAGKSTLISRISSAKPKIADYPFTTLIPNLGVVKKRSGDGYVVADIPGLIEGASEGIGLGHDFLRHIERCRFLVHLVDCSEENPFDNYMMINNELAKHSEELADLYQIVVLNKIDSVFEETLEEIYNQFKTVSEDIFEISAVTGEHLTEFVDFMSKKVDEIPKRVSQVVVEEDLDAYNNDDSAYEIHKAAKGVYIVVGGKISRLAGVTDERNTEQVLRLQNILKSMGVFDKLTKLGITDGDTIILGHLEFAFYKEEMYG